MLFKFGVVEITFRLWLEYAENVGTLNHHEPVTLTDHTRRPEDNLAEKLNVHGSVLFGVKRPMKDYWMGSFQLSSYKLSLHIWYVRIYRYAYIYI